MKRTKIIHVLHKSDPTNKEGSVESGYQRSIRERDSVRVFPQSGSSPQSNKSIVSGRNHVHMLSARSKVTPTKNDQESTSATTIHKQSATEGRSLNGDDFNRVPAKGAHYQGSACSQSESATIQNDRSVGNTSNNHSLQSGVSKNPMESSSIRLDWTDECGMQYSTREPATKNQLSNIRKSFGQIANINYRTILNKNIKNQKYFKPGSCKCTLLCTILSILGLVLIGGLVAGVLVGTLVSRVPTTTTTATTVTTTSVTSATTTTTTSMTTTTSTSTTSTSRTTSTTSTTSSISTSTSTSTSTTSTSSSTSSTTSSTSTSTSTSTTSTSTTSSTASTSTTSTSTSTTSPTTVTTTSTTTTTTTTTTSTTAGCNPICLNGGTCVLSNNTCICNEEVWTGSQCQTPVRILWTFDNNLLDFYGNFPGTPVNNPTYQLPGIDGYGSCLYLNASASQSVTIRAPPFLNMAYTSFSLSAWVKANSLRQCWLGCCDNAVFGQFDQNTQSRSLHIIVRNTRIYFGFFSDDTQGSEVLQPNVWYHMAYIYDYPTRTQSVYVNGVLDQANTVRGPYRGVSGDLTIGTNGVCAPSNTWDGCIDRISYFARAKSAAEVLRDATLTVSYAFNGSLIDDGPLGINGTGMNVQYSNIGRVDSALNLSINPSFAEASGLVYLGTDGHPYSISIWIRPSSVSNGTIVHVSPSSGPTTWSMPMLGFATSGQIRAQACSTSGPVSLTGPIVSMNAWTHVAITYSQTNRFRLWVNGTQVASSSSTFSSSTIDAPVKVTLGTSMSGAAGACASTSIAMGQYYGLIDEFQLYSRELSSTEIVTLAT